jgi:hypothetical protein
MTTKIGKSQKEKKEVLKNNVKKGAISYMLHPDGRSLVFIGFCEWFNRSRQQKADMAWLCC